MKLEIFESYNVQNKRIYFWKIICRVAGDVSWRKFGSMTENITEKAINLVEERRVLY